jgi:hypothetical protein
MLEVVSTEAKEDFGATDREGVSRGLEAEISGNGARGVSEEAGVAAAV